MRKIICLFISAIALGACSSIECPLNNTVMSVYSLKGEVTSMEDTLTISTIRRNGTDTILLNQAVNVSTIKIPVSYAQDQDVLVFTMTDTLRVVRTDTVRISKTNEPHFESIDCGATYFHTITNVSYTRNAIDSIVVSTPKITYDATQEHFHIYFKPRN